MTGAPAFVRQILDDLPALLGRLRGVATGRTAISMPPPPPAVEASAPATPIAETRAVFAAAPREAGSSTGNRQGAARNGRSASPPDGADGLEEEVFAVLRNSGRPLAVAAIRGLLASDASGQQVRRLLERAGSRVKVSADKPATYTLR